MSGQQLLDVREPLDAVDEVGALGEPGRVVRVEVEVATHARRRVDHDVDAAVPDPPDDLAVERDLAGAAAAARIPHVDVHDGGARPGRRDAGLGDLLRCHGHVVGLADRVPGAGQRARDDDLAVHLLDPSREAVATVSTMAGSVRRSARGSARRGRRPCTASRRLHDDRAPGTVDVDELAAAAVRGHAGARPRRGATSGTRTRGAPTGARAAGRARRFGSDGRETRRPTHPGRRRSGAGPPGPSRPPRRPRRRPPGHPVAVDGDHRVLGASQACATARPSASRKASPVARSRTQSSTWESAVQYAKRVPGGYAGGDPGQQRTRRAAARRTPGRARLAGPSGSRWSSTQSTPLVIRATSRTGTPR